MATLGAAVWRKGSIERLTNDIINMAIAVAHDAVAAEQPELERDDHYVEPQYANEVMAFLADLMVNVLATQGHAFTGWGEDQGARWLVFGEDFEGIGAVQNDLPGPAYRWTGVGGVRSFHRELCQALVRRGALDQSMAPKEG